MMSTATEPYGDTRLIGVDWGTSSLRAYRICENGDPIEERASPAGIMNVAGGAFESALMDVAGDWLEAIPCPVLLSGMITSRQGWVELPYLSCPAGKDELSAALHQHRLSNGQDIHLVTGLTVAGPDGVPDVMRGEETQIIGALGAGRQSGLFVLPGTHSKWVRAEAGRIVDFATFMTGELFSILSNHSILGRMMDGNGRDEDAFGRGVEYGGKADQESGGLLKRLFGSRALGLFGAVSNTGAASHLSGLLIGSEIREALDYFGSADGASGVTVLGDAELVDFYLVALGQSGIDAMPGEKAVAARGQYLIAQAAELV